MVMTRRDVLTVSAAGMAFCFASPGSQAAAEPLLKTAHILTGFTPGLPDAVARLIADQMKDYAGTIVVEPRPGATGRVAVEAVKTAAPDGSVILLAPLGFMTLFPHIYRTLRYGVQDFIPVTTVASFPALLTVGPKAREATTLAEFITWCRAHPKQATYGTPGAVSTLHLIGAMLGRSAGFEFLHVPYQGKAATLDLLKGEIASTIMPLSSSIGLVQSGELRALATTGPRRSPFLPDVPTMAEAGYPSLEEITWFGIFVPTKTPSETVQRLNGAIQQALRTDEVKSGLQKQFVEIGAISGADFAGLIASESKRWKAIVQTTEFLPTD